MLIDEKEKLISTKMLCEITNRLENALEGVKVNDELNDEKNEEVVILCEKIDVLEYQNTVNVARLEEYAMKEDE